MTMPTNILFEKFPWGRAGRPGHVNTLIWATLQSLNPVTDESHEAYVRLMDAAEFTNRLNDAHIMQALLDFGFPKSAWKALEVAHSAWEGSVGVMGFYAANVHFGDHKVKLQYARRGDSDEPLPQFIERLTVFIEVEKSWQDREDEREARSKGWTEDFTHPSGRTAQSWGQAVAISSIYG